MRKTYSIWRIVVCISDWWAYYGRNSELKEMRSDTVLLRALDLTLFFLALTLGFPLLLGFYVALLIFEDGDPVFRQKRIGRNGKAFLIFKFRTLATGTAQVPSHELGDVELSKLQRFLRDSKLDELPQIINVFKGQMSFVGPRPCLPTQVELIEKRKKSGLIDFLPGITGYAQIKRVAMDDVNRLVDLESYFYGQYSIQKYLKIIIWQVIEIFSLGSKKFT